MTSGRVQLDQLWDADAYYANGGMPWSVLGYPSNRTNQHGLPDDAEAQEFLAKLQVRGFKIGIWKYPDVDRYTYAVVDKASIQPVMLAIDEMKTIGEISDDFFDRFVERLWPQS